MNKNRRKGEQKPKGVGNGKKPKISDTAAPVMVAKLQNAAFRPDPNDVPNEWRLMAGAEARAFWQRTANRCCVQEDAKRLACCQPSSSINQVDGGSTGAENVPDHHTAGFMPLDRNPSYANLPPDNCWWFQLHPRYGYQKCLTCEEMSALEVEMDNLSGGMMTSASKTGKVDGSETEDSLTDVHRKISSDCMKKDAEVGRLLYDENALDCRDFQDLEKNSKQIDFDPLGCLPSKKGPEHSLDLETPWMGAEKNVPWWRSTDRDDLASLVAQKSLELIDNCDLPSPQKTQFRRFPRPRSSDHEDTRSSLDWKARTEQVITDQSHSRGCHSSESTHVAESYTKTDEDTAEGGQLFEDDPCKAQLLEALRHSQTRAREAEDMAKQACAEKDDIVKLFLRQASQLFAYKQWFQLLQLEALYYQFKNTDQSISTLFPVDLPWAPLHSRKLRKSWLKSNQCKRGKRGGRSRHDIGRYAVAFAVGLSLVGAGLLLGWTVGWMLPF